MRKLISLALLLSPFFAGLAFPSVGDTVTYDNVRYIITDNPSVNSAGKVSLYQVLESANITIPTSIYTKVIGMTLQILITLMTAR